MVDADTTATVTSTGHLSQRMTGIAVRLPGIDGCRPFTGQHVQAVCGGHDVTFTRSYTGRGSAGVVEIKPVRDGADHELVHNPVCAHQAPLSIVETVTPDESVAVFVEGSLPDPAAFGLGELAMPAVFQRCGLRRHTSIVTSKGKRRDLD